MPWTTPTLRNVREMVRGEVTGALQGATFIGNSVLRVMADMTAAVAHLVLRYIDWLALQLLPDTAETEWLDRHGDIWLVNSDSSTGRKMATLAHGVVTMTGTAGFIVPAGTQFNSATTTYETTEEITLGIAETEVDVRALDAGIAGNLSEGDTIDLVTSIPGVDGEAVVVFLVGGVDEETDDELRMRVLERIREPPMGGDAEDYVAWALQVPGVTRAWAAPNEMGIGTVTVRFMMDDLRETDDPLTNGFPAGSDVDTVKAYLNTKRPVAVKDFFCFGPIPFPIVFGIAMLTEDTASVRAAIADRVDEMIRNKAKPSSALNGSLVIAQTIYAAWVSEAILSVPNVVSFDLLMGDAVMPNNGSIGVLGEITYFAAMPPSGPDLPLDMP